MSGHAFVAADLSDAERHGLSAALASASPGTPLPGRRQPPRNWHITLRFLGECSDAEADRVAYELSTTVDAERGRAIAGGLGAFPRRAKASVLYVEIDDADGLVAHLGAACESVARDVGFEPEERPFVPHLTLSRLRPPRDLRHLIDSYGDFRVPIRISSMTIFRSNQSRSGLFYDPLHVVELPERHR